MFSSSFVLLFFPDDSGSLFFVQDFNNHER